MKIEVYFILIFIGSETSSTNGYRAMHAGRMIFLMWPYVFYSHQCSCLFTCLGDPILSSAPSSLNLKQKQALVIQELHVQIRHANVIQTMLFKSMLS